jgi:hypothetical protein
MSSPPYDTLVIGGGPAGLAAGVEAARAGLSVCVVDERPTFGGQIFKQPGRGFRVTNAKALGVAPYDFNGDGKIDLAVANDTAPNNLYRNNGDGTFTDVAVEAGVAVNEAGRSRGAMGVDWSDAKPGGASLAIGNFSNEMKSLYWTDSGDVFLDLSASSGIGRDSLLSLTFGVFFFDYDLDGRSDLFFSNGHVENSIQDVQKAVSYRQPPTLYWNAGDGRMSDATKAAGLDVPFVGRGCAFGDLDGDGDLDVVLVENGGPAHVFLNRLDRPRMQDMPRHAWGKLEFNVRAAVRDVVCLWLHYYPAFPDGQLKAKRQGEGGTLPFGNS